MTKVNLATSIQLIILISAISIATMVSAASTLSTFTPLSSSPSVIPMSESLITNLDTGILVSKNFFFESKSGGLFQQRMDQFVEDQEKEARAQMDVLVADYQDMLERLQLAHDRKLNELKADRDRSKDKARQQYETLVEQHKRLQSDYDTLSQQHGAQRDQLEMRIKELQAKLNENLMVANLVPHSDPQHSMASSSQDGQIKDEADNDGEINNRQLVLVQQHKNELQLLHRQYQQSLDTKDRDLEAYAYRLESLKVAQQRELASCQSEAKHRIRLLVCQMEGYKTTIQGYINTLDETQSHIATLEQQKEHDRYTIQKLTREKQMLEDRLSRLHPLNG